MIKFLLALLCVNMTYGQAAPQVTVIGDPIDSSFADAFTYGLNAGTKFSGGRPLKIGTYRLHSPNPAAVPPGLIFAPSSVASSLGQYATQWQNNRTVIVVDQMPDPLHIAGFKGIPRSLILDAAAKTLEGVSPDQIAYSGPPAGLDRIEQHLIWPDGSIQNLDTVPDPTNLRYVIYSGGRDLSQQATALPNVTFLNLSGAQSFDWNITPGNVLTYAGVADPNLALKSGPTIKQAAAQGLNPAVAMVGFSWARYPSGGQKIVPGVVTLQKVGPDFKVGLPGRTPILK